MPSIHDARLAIMGDLPAVGKDGRNLEDGYDFRSADAVIAAVRPLLVRHRVAASPTVLASRVRPRPTHGGGTVMHATVTVEWRFEGPERDHDEVVVVGEAMDHGDKALSKAQTVAQRVAWSQWLAIPTHEVDPDAASYQVARPARRQRAAARPAPTDAAPVDSTVADAQLAQLAALMGHEEAVEFWCRSGQLGVPRAPRVFEAMVHTASRIAAQSRLAAPTPAEWVAGLTATEVSGHLRGYGLDPTGDLNTDRDLLELAATEETTDADA